MINNLSQLKRSLKENMLLEITGHCRAECVGEIRRITKVNTQGFCSTPHPLVEQGAILEF